MASAAVESDQEGIRRPRWGVRFQRALAPGYPRDEARTFPWLRGVEEPGTIEYANCLHKVPQCGHVHGPDLDLRRGMSARLGYARSYTSSSGFAQTLAKAGSEAAVA